MIINEEVYVSWNAKNKINLSFLYINLLDEKVRRTYRKHNYKKYKIKNLYDNTFGRKCFL